MKYSITATVLIILSLVLLGFVRQGTTPKWEYKTEVYSLIDVDWEPNPQIVKEERIEARAHRESVSKLASLGSSGWELVNLTPVAIAHELSTKQDFQTNEPLSRVWVCIAPPLNGFGLSLGRIRCPSPPALGLRVSPSVFPPSPGQGDTSTSCAMLGRVGGASVHPPQATPNSSK